ncbi:hypothetical protein Kfla_4956 [Kribbella flavida DSM 17836]|uniref:Fibronectin type-III domain-containing protein n=1 Tax=Kribbella flavida (strain DSM 17836 / JCM 10339 / NBRC 14399) TaxID=479435 RepID=D2Q226_KRIFD|nr:hypothetical protein [Kribbella flavida]ADB33972.1 hypothetical protein Kfla_4956 [Kribbella flavida DSM 17836]
MLKGTAARVGGALVAVGALLTATGTAAAGPPVSTGTQRTAALSGVQVEWVDVEHTNIRITWSESSPVANTLTVLSSAAGGAPAEFGTTPADAPNEYVIDSASLGTTADPAVKRWIVVAAPDGTSARSVDFDTFGYVPSSIALSHTTDGQVRWTVPGDTTTDGTPGDPLDVAKEYRYLVQRSVDPDPAAANIECDVVDYPETTTPTGVLPNIGRPYSLRVNVDNEWGARPGRSAEVTTTPSVTLTGPASTAYGTSTTLTGQVSRRSLYISGSPPACDEANGPAAGQSVVLQQRTSSTAAWTVVGTVKTDSTGKYTAVITNPGYREYRVVQANTASGPLAVYGATSATKVVRSTTRVMSAKFISPVITYGTTPQAYLWVEPAGSQQAALQFKNASGVWQGVTTKTLSAGRGTATFPWNRRGSAQFRWWVPASGGADAVYSPVFTLTVN